MIVNGMSTQSKEYFNKCIADNDLTIFGIYDPKQDYAIFHKWGTSSDIENITKVMKQSIAKSKVLDGTVFVTYKYPEFELEDFDKFLNCAGYFGDWHKKRLKSLCTLHQ